MHDLRALVMSPKRAIALILFVPFVCSQAFWLWKIRVYKQRLCRSKTLRLSLDAAGAALYVTLFIYGLFNWRLASGSTHLTLRAAFVVAPCSWWFFGSMTGFIIYLLVRGFGFLMSGVQAVLMHATRRGREGAHEAASASPSVAPAVPGIPMNPGRRRFFRGTATVLGVAPFVAGAYGLLRGRLDLEVTNVRLVLPRLPRAFDGFRILQLSDLHIGPFMSAGEIRNVVEIANRAKPDLVALTGDFVIWDPATQFAVVDALSGLRAPSGVWGCLGNHEIYTHIEDSITGLFAARGIRILRQQHAMVFAQPDFINLIGTDFESHWTFGAYKDAGYVETYLKSVEKLMLPGTVNLLMSHNPNVFDRAAELGVDLTVAGHTHGGQISLELGGDTVSPVRLLTAYVAGWFRKGGAQLYVNRGIGTIGLPIRLGAPPEITIYQLARNA